MLCEHASVHSLSRSFRSAWCRWRLGIWHEQSMLQLFAAGCKQRERAVFWRLRRGADAIRRRVTQWRSAHLHRERTLLRSVLCGLRLVLSLSKQTQQLVESSFRRHLRAAQRQLLLTMHADRLVATDTLRLIGISRCHCRRACLRQWRVRVDSKLRSLQLLVCTRAARPRYARAYGALPNRAPRDTLHAPHLTLVSRCHIWQVGLPPRGTATRRPLPAAPSTNAARADTRGHARGATRERVRRE